MALVTESGRQHRAGVAPQTTWGTGAAAGDTFGLLNVDPIDFPDVAHVTAQPGYSGVRRDIQSNVAVDQNMALPEFNVKGRAKLLELASFIYANKQSVTEGASTPFKKTIIPHDSQPDFTVNAGHFMSFCDRHATAAESLLYKDVITKSLKLSCYPGTDNGFLQLDAGMVGRGAPSAITPSGTWAPLANTFWNFGDLVRFTVNFGSGAVALVAGGFEIESVWTHEGVGGASGQFQTIGLGFWSGKFKLKVLKDSNWATARANLLAKTQVTVNIAWGNATAGTVTGDLDFTIIGLLDEPIKSDKADIAYVTYPGRMLGVDAAAIPFTTIIADGQDKGW